MRPAAIVLCALLFLAGAGGAEQSLPEGGSARLVMIVDDFGYSVGGVVSAFLELDEGLTISVIPGLRYSEIVTGMARSAGKEVLAHLPLEPLDYPVHDPGPGAVFTNMPDEEIRGTLRAGLDSFTGLVGANNHMGSRAMRDERVVRILLEEVKERNLFFLDSKTIPGRTAKRLARQIGVTCLENDLFWDSGYDTEEKILANLDRLAEIALRRGFAIGIGHPRREALEALKRKLPEFRKLGIMLVPITDLVGDPSRPGGGIPRFAGKRAPGG